MNNQESTDQLEKEIHIGEKASKAYSLWVNDYIRLHREQLFDTFYEADLEEYPYIHAEVTALNNIEYAIRVDMETGNLARKQLHGDEFYQKQMKED
jgi:hypothetical protein